MKKQYLLVLIFALFQFSEAQAQESCCLQMDNTKAIEQGKEFNPISQDLMKLVLEEEIKLFTNYLNENFEYPELAKYNMLEGNMIVQIIYDEGFDSIQITKSVDPEIDEMVLENIREYVNNFDREYPGTPRLSFVLPINFSMR